MSIKSEVANAKENLINSRKAILARGGEIATDAGFKDLPSAILNIPPDFALSFIEDDGVAYQKNAPENSLPYAQIKKIGGMTYKSKNLIPYPYADTSKTENGITWTINTDGSVTANGTATGNSYFTFVKSSTLLTIPYDMTISGCPSGGNSLKYEIHVWKGGFAIEDIGSSNKVPAGTTYKEIYAVVREGYTANNLTFKPMLNAGTTALPYEPFFEGLRNAAVEEVKSEGAYGTIDTFTIPQAVQELDGYGVGLNTDCYNYVDFNARTFVKKVGGVDLGTLDFSVYNSNENRIVFTAQVENIQNHYNGETSAPILADGYRTVSQEQTWMAGEISQSSKVDEYKYIRVVEKADVTLEEFKSLVNGRMLYYALETPEVTDISSILAENNFIKVEGGGTLTFENEYGYAVPSTVKYVLGVG